jgi:dCTP deaminase
VTPAPLDLPSEGRGVLPDHWIERLIENDVVTAATPIPAANIQPASLDLRLGDRAYRLRSSFLPDRRDIERQLKELALGPPLDLSDGGILERGRPYLIPLQERLDLPLRLRARANPKSSTGRVDVFTRLITDRGFRFDDVSERYRGPLYLEVASRTFTIMVREGLSLNQMRFSLAHAPVPDTELRQLHREDALLFRDDKPLATNQLAAHNGLFMSLDLRHTPERTIGWRAKQHSGLLDLSRVGAYNPTDFWEPLAAEPGDQLVLDPEDFYLLLSEEAVRVPPDFAAEMTAYDPTSGELRTHYAGFFDPGFGHDRARLLRGSRATLEVRAHDVAFLVRHLQRVCKVSFERMFEAPKTLYGEGQSNYQSQQATLSKHFKFARPKDEQLELPSL